MDDLLFETGLRRLRFTDQSHVVFYSAQDGGSKEWLSPKQLQEILRVNIDSFDPQPGFDSDSNSNTNSDDKHQESPKFDLFTIVGTGCIFPIHLTRTLFVQMLDHLGVPRVFVQSIEGNNGHYSVFTTYKEQNAVVMPQALYVMVATPLAPEERFSCCLRIRLSDGAVSGILLDSEQDRVRECSLLLDLRKKDLSQSPIALLVLLLEHYGYGCETERQTLDKDVQRAESSTGFTLWSSNRITAAKYEQLSKEMHICQNSLLILLHMMEFEKEFGEFLCRTIDRLVELRTECGLKPEPAWKRIKVLQDLEYHLTTCRRRRVQTEMLHDRIKTQINVMAGFIAQRDSQATISMAVVAQRDSGAMRTIAVLTLFFLPATLVSAIFSSGVIDDTANLWWVFLLSVTMSTMTVFALWFWYMRFRASRAEGALWGK